MPDAESIAWLCLVEAYRTYDMALGVPFAGYAASRVKFGVWNAVKKQNRYYEKESMVAEGEGNDFWDYLPAAADVAGEAERRVDMVNVYAALKALPAKQRQVICWTVLEDQPLTAVARKMGVSEQAVNNLKQRGLKNLRKVV